MLPLTAPALIEAPRVELRLLIEDDLPALLEVNGDPQVTAMLPYATWASIDDAKAWFDRMATMQATGLALQFAILDRRTDRAIGSCLLFRFDAGSARAELGYVLGRAHWGQGLMQEALTALIDCSFGVMGLRRLEAEVDPRNVGSTHVVERLGFVREGLARERWTSKGEHKDVVSYGLLAREWRPAR